MKRHDLKSSAIFFCIGLFVAIYATHFGIGSTSMPGSGFMPFLSGLVICSFSAITFFRAFFDKSTGVEKIWAKGNYPKVVFVIIMLILYALPFETLGFIICSFLLILILMRYVGPQTWLTSIVVAGLSSIISYLLFETWLQTQLPKGIFGF